MPLPLIPFAIGAASAAGGSVVQRFLSPSIDQLTNATPSDRASTYAQNLAKPNLYPNPEVLLSLYHAGYIKREDLSTTLKAHGIRAGGEGATSDVWRLWDRHIKLTRTKLGIETVVALYRAGLLDFDETNERLHEHGMSSSLERTLTLNLDSPLPAGDVLDLHARGTMSRADAGTYLNRLGYIHGNVRDLLLDRQPPIGQAAADQLLWRGFVQRGGWEEYTRRQGFHGREDLERLHRLTEFMPPPSDLIRFAVKDIFDPNLPDRAGMLEELGEQKELLDWLRAQGIGEITFKTRDGRTLTRNAAELYWLASFELPSPTQAYHMLHRLRPGRVDKWAVPGQTPEQVRAMATGIADVRALLKDKDYRPGWRDRLAAISYSTVGRIDLRRFYKDGVFGEPLGTAGFERLPGGRYRPTGEAEQEVYESQLDNGLSPVDSGRMAYWLSLDWERGKGGRQRSQTGKLLCRAYTSGALTRGQTFDRLRAAGFGGTEANTFLDNCDLEHSLKVLEKMVAATRSGYLSGALTAEQARARLSGYGVHSERVRGLLTLWDAENLRRPREATAAQLCEWVGSGLITPADMLTRLRNLGWREADAQRVVRHCVLGHLGRSAREREKLARAQAQQEERRRRQAEQLARRSQMDERQRRRELERRAERALRQVREGRSPDRLGKYLKAGLIDPREALAVLVERGWLRPDAERFIRLNTPEGVGGGN